MMLCISAARTYCTTYNRKIRNPSGIVVVMRKKVSVGVGQVKYAEYKLFILSVLGDIKIFLGVLTVLKFQLRYNFISSAT